MNNHAKRALLSNKEAATYLRMSESWLNKDRGGGALIPFIKLGTRVLYDVEDLDAFLTRNRRRSTADNGKKTAS